MMRILNGIFFGAGLGLITMAMGKMADGYTSSAYIVGTILIIAAIGSLMFTERQT
ncbi:MAG: hypothetical protein K9G26_00705 [Emcibacter sp.]|nr:hypothetical protein [Emcibacter sp.]